MSYGLHYTDTLAGRVFCQSATPLGLAVPIYTATSVGGGIPIFNPPGSGVNVEMISYDLGEASGTAVYGVIGVIGVPLQGVASGTPCTALANTTPQNMKLGSGNQSRVVSSNAGTTTVTAGAAVAPTQTTPGWIRTIAQINGEGAAAGLHGTLVPRVEFNGTLIVPPGWLIYLGCTLASVSLIGTSVVWKEVPLIPGT